MIDYFKNISPQKTIAIVGISKNSGKTSFLNWFIYNLNSEKIFVTTTGRDGEDTDLVTGQAKPKVYLPKNTFFTSFSYVINEQSSCLKVIKKLPNRVIGKELWLYKTLEDIKTEVVGPTTLREQEILVNNFDSDKLDYFIIDGSLDRKSICLSEKTTDIFLIIGASAGSYSEIIEQAENLSYYTQLKSFSIEKNNTITYFLKNRKIVSTDLASIYSNESFISEILLNNPEWIYFPGAITDHSWNKLSKRFMEYQGKLIFEHPLNINIKFSELKRFLRSKDLYTRLRFPISLVGVNSFSVYDMHIDADKLRSSIKKIFNDIPVIDITELIVY